MDRTRCASPRKSVALSRGEDTPVRPSQICCSSRRRSGTVGVGLVWLLTHPGRLPADGRAAGPSHRSGLRPYVLAQGDGERKGGLTRIGGIPSRTRKC
jgi:hypothetical protein